MNLHTLKPAAGATKNRKRIGRGQGSGHGGTATKGNNGARQRSGYKSKRAHEGGQMPIQRRLPKFGFKNINRIEYVPVNLDLLQVLAEKNNVTEVTAETFRSFGIASKNEKVKILGRGELKSKMTISAHKASESAVKAIEAAGGSFKKI